MENLKKIFAWCRIPLTYGNVVRNGNRSGKAVETVENVSYNGMISSVQMFIAIIAVSIATNLSVYLSVKFNSAINLFVLIALMLIGLIVMFIFNIYRKSFIVSTSEHDPEHDNLPVIAIVIFFLLGCLLDMFHTIATISCDEVWSICNTKQIYETYVTEITFNILKIVYLGGETMFCMTYNRCTFSDKPSTRYGLMLLQATNFSLWFDALIRESSHMFHYRPRVPRFYQRCLGDNMNVSEKVLECVFHNNTFYDTANNLVSPATLPFSIEFTLFAGEFLCHWFFHCAASTAKFDSRERGNEANETYDLTEREDDEVDGQNLPADDSGIVSEHHSFSANTDDPPENVIQSRSMSIAVIIYLVITIAVNVSFFVLASLGKWTTISAMQNVFVCYMFAFWMLTTISVAVGFHISRGFKYESETPFNGFDCLLLLSSIGPMTFLTFTMTAFVGLQPYKDDMQVIYSQSSSIYQPFQIMLELCNGFQVHLQTAFGYFAERIVFNSSDNGHKPLLFKYIILFLAIANGTMWPVCTSEALQAKESLLHMKFFDRHEWDLIGCFTTPLSLFFRCNSCLLFTKVFLKIHKGDAVDPEVS